MPGLLLPSGRFVDVHDGFIIGVDAGCDLRLVDAQAAARHLILQRVGEEGWQAATLTSSAKTQINGAAVTGLARLNDGDVLTVGETDLIWQLVSTSAVVGAPILAPRAWGDVLLAAIVLGVLVLAVWQQSRWRHENVVSPTPTASPTIPVCPPTVTVTCRPPLYRVIVPAPNTPAPTSSLTPLPIPSLSPSATATATPSITPSPSAALTPIPTLPAIRTCPIPEGWVKKVVRQDETLPGLARRFGVALARLRQANCLENNQIKWGQILYVPAGP